MLDLRCLRRFLWIGALLCLIVPASASAAETIGSNLNALPDGSTPCALEQCTSAHQTLPPASTAAGGLLAPSDGVVVRWRINVGAAAGPVALRITGPGNSDIRNGFGTGVTVNPGADQISVFSARLPIEAGDALGLDHLSTAAFASTGGAETLDWNPPLADGGGFIGGEVTDLELLLNADIEADADGDGYGDETQDECSTDPTTQGPCPDPPPVDPGDSSLELFVGRFPRIHERVTMRATGFAAAPLKLWIYADSRGRKCPAKPSFEGPRVREVFAGEVEGEIQVEERVKMKSRGRHSFCAYLGRTRASNKLVRASKSRLVRRQRLQAARAKDTVVQALKSHLFAARVIAHLKKNCNRRNRATFRCQFSSKFPGYAMNGHGSVRLNKELTYRFVIRVGKLEYVLTDKNEGKFPPPR